METLFNNKRFINLALLFLLLLSLFTLAKFINEVKASSYVGRGSQPPSTITVSGTGDVMAVSDIATLSVNISREGATSKEAQSALNTQVAKVLDYLKTTAIDQKDIKSEYGGLNPKYSNDQVVCYAYPCPQRDAKIVGYTANQSITIKVRDVDTANDIRTGLANTGVTDISGPTFSIDDTDTFTDQARAKAIDDAREKAEVLARELGVHLGKVVSFSDNAGGYPIMYAAKDMAVGSAPQAAPAPELPKGENKITSNVSITYEIR